MNATVYPIPSRFEQDLQRELTACGWTEANRHFDRACNAALARDDDAFTREMAEFNRIKATWAIAASGTVAGRQSPSQSSLSRPLSRRPSTIAGSAS